MLLGALVDAGASLDDVQDAVDAVVPGSVRLTRTEVHRGGQRATKVDVEVLVPDPPHRRWTDVRSLLERADLAEVTRARALGTFGRLARAEGGVHGTSPEDVHFHEVGALDAVADVVGVCEAIRLLGVEEVSATAIALGEGRARAAHGDIPVPVPAVVELVLGWPVTSGALPAGGGEPPQHSNGVPHTHELLHAHDAAHTHDAPHPGDVVPHTHDAAHPGDVVPHTHDTPHPGDGSRAAPATRRSVGELATPTGVALVRELATAAGPLPDMVAEAVGVGAGSKDVPGRPNVVRVVIGAPGRGSGTATDEVVQLEANVDDLDPRLWPGVLAALLTAGAVDAWLTPILMKKGRPAHTVHALCPQGAAEAVTGALFATTSTIGVRRHAPLHRRVLARRWQEVLVDGRPVRIKVAHDGTLIRQATPEFDDVAALAAELALPERDVLARAAGAARAAGLAPGRPLTP